MGRRLVLTVVFLAIVSSASFACAAWRVESQVGFDGNISDIEIGPDGSIYVSTNYFGGDDDKGNVYRLKLSDGELNVVSGLFKYIFFPMQQSLSSGSFGALFIQGDYGYVIAHENDLDYGWGSCISKVVVFKTTMEYKTSIYCYENPISLLVETERLFVGMDSPLVINQVDISQPTSPFPIGMQNPLWGDEKPVGMKWSETGSRLFVATGEGLKVFDYSTIYPIPLHQYLFTNNGVGYDTVKVLVGDENTFYVLCHSPSVGGRIFAVNDPNLDTPGQSVVADDSCGSSYCSTSLPGDVQDMVKVGESIFVVAGAAGVYEIDIGDFQNPEVVYSGNANVIQQIDGKLLVGDGKTLRLLKEVLPGDVDGNGEIKLADVVLALRVVAGVANNASVNFDADVDGDGVIGIGEILYIFQRVVDFR